MNDNTTLQLPDVHFRSPIGHGSSGPSPDPMIDARAEELLRSADANLLDPRILQLLDSEDLRDRITGVDLAEIQLADIRQAAIAEAKRQADIAREREASRMAEVWEMQQNELVYRRHLPLFVTLCLLFEFVSEEKCDEVMVVIEQYNNCNFYDHNSIVIWAMKVRKLMPYLERRQDLILTRRAAKAQREKGQPNTTPGVDWSQGEAKKGDLGAPNPQGIGTQPRGKVLANPRNRAKKAKGGGVKSHAGRQNGTKKAQP